MNIAVIGTLDTKADEVAFLRDQVKAHGCTPIVYDPGSGGEPKFVADVSREEIASAGGASLADLLATEDKATIQNGMISGLVNTITQAYAAGQFAGVVSVGGGQGTAIATAAMRALPVGVPKVMVSTVANGKTTFGPYVGTKDITMIHSVADISGLNFVTQKIIAQAAAAVCAMASVEMEYASEGDLIAITQAGVTTPGVMEIKRLLEEKGFEVIAFHCNGIGGEAMEQLIQQGVIKGVIDYSPHEITDLLYDGLMPAMPGRMTVAGKMGIPQVVAPGCTDIRLHEWRDDFSEELLSRKYVRHTPTHTHFRTTADEMRAVAEYVAQSLNQGEGPRAAIVPLRGYSMLNHEGKPLYDEDANHAYADSLRENLTDDVELVEADQHINDTAFANATVDLFLKLYNS